MNIHIQCFSTKRSARSNMQATTTRGKNNTTITVINMHQTISLH